MSGASTAVRDALDRIRTRSIDRDFIPQERLDVASRDRVSAFPWRGQFTPGLVTTLLERYGRSGLTVLDPFAGSGTTLAEANRHRMDAIGCEVNPAAVELARVFTLAGIPAAARAAALKDCRDQLANCSPPSPGSLSDLRDSCLIDDVLRAYKQCPTSESANLVAVTMMLAMGDSRQLDAPGLNRGLAQLEHVVRDLPDEQTSCRIYAADARALPLPPGCVDLVMTSPPYINVFNYHQNYRPAVELLGWQVLPAARTEIGSNRKHRQNRFFTVIQYAIDMMLALEELCRVCTAGAQVVIVIGRESRVRGISFANGIIISSLAELLPAMSYVRWQERRFTNRFGELIYEEILTFEITKGAQLAGDNEYAAEVGRQLLISGRSQARSSEVAAEIDAAVEHSSRILPSPELALVRTNPGPGQSR